MFDVLSYLLESNLCLHLKILRFNHQNIYCIYWKKSSFSLTLWDLPQLIPLSLTRFLLFSALSLNLLYLSSYLFDSPLSYFLLSFSQFDFLCFCIFSNKPLSSSSWMCSNSLYNTHRSPSAYKWLWWWRESNFYRGQCIKMVEVEYISYHWMQNLMALFLVETFISLFSNFGWLFPHASTSNHSPSCLSCVPTRGAYLHVSAFYYIKLWLIFTDITI